MESDLLSVISKEGGKEKGIQTSCSALSTLCVEEIREKSAQGNGKQEKCLEHNFLVKGIQDSRFFWCIPYLTTRWRFGLCLETQKVCEEAMSNLPDLQRDFNFKKAQDSEIGLHRIKQQYKKENMFFR